MSAWGDARDQIALEAMKCLLANPHPALVADPRSIAPLAYWHADAMLAVLEKREGDDG